MPGLPLLAVDPSLRGCGFALFTSRGDLSAVWLLDAPHLEAAAQWQTRILWPADVAIEIPQVYTGKIRTDPNDLIAVAAVAGMIAREAGLLGGRATFYRPRQWKGNAPKDVIRARVEVALRAEEVTVYRAARKKYGSRFHNVVDAIGIDLFHLGRMPL